MTCTRCGAFINENIQHSCTAAPMALAVNNSAAVAQTPAATEYVAPTLPLNIAAALTYAAGFISGIAFLVLEPYKHDGYVRFHAWQSLIFSLAWSVLWIPSSVFTSTLIGGLFATSMGGPEGAAGLPFLVLFITALNRLLGLAGFVYWMFLLYQAYSNQRYQIPIIGRFAAAQASLGIS